MLQLQECSLNKKPFWLVNEQYRFGTAEVSDIVLNDSALEAAILHVNGHTVELVPLDNVHVYVNDEQISQPAELKAGDTFKINMTVFLLIDPKQILSQSDQANVSEGNKYELISESQADVSFEVEHSMTVGRASDAGKVISRSGISRHHAELTPGNDGLLVRDLNSSNGTTINEKLIDEAIAKYGDKIGFGGINYIVGRPETTKDFDNTTVRPILLDDPLGLSSSKQSSVPASDNDDRENRLKYHREQIRGSAQHATLSAREDNSGGVVGWSAFFLLLSIFFVVVYWLFV